MIFADWAIYSVRRQLKRRLTLYTARLRQHLASGDLMLFLSTLLCIRNKG